ncbi:MAG: gamma-glutamyl-gamma-aminobutyrate hydrolase family protein, partial [Phycisphaerales bacterium]
MLPIIGITSDYHKKRHRVGCGYTNAVTLAGGIPVILPAIQDCIPQYKEMCDGFIFTGGDDPVMEEWGIASHPSTTPVHTERQSFELA